MTAQADFGSGDIPFGRLDVGQSGRWPDALNRAAIRRLPTVSLETSRTAALILANAYSMPTRAVHRFGDTPTGF